MRHQQANLTKWDLKSVQSNLAAALINFWGDKSCELISTFEKSEQGVPHAIASAEVYAEGGISDMIPEKIIHFQRNSVINVIALQKLQ